MCFIFWCFVLVQRNWVGFTCKRTLETNSSLIMIIIILMMMMMVR